MSDPIQDDRVIKTRFRLFDNRCKYAGQGHFWLCQELRNCLSVQHMKPQEQPSPQNRKKKERKHLDEVQKVQM